VHTVVAGVASTDPVGHAVLAATTLQTPVVVLQHALGPHGFGAHVVPSPRYVPPPGTCAHPKDPVTSQVLLAVWQHAPMHGLFGMHVVPTPLKAPLTAVVHPSCVVNWQAPVPPEPQHAPSSARHGFVGMHVVPLPW
jgi:hypothetical protein